MTRLALCVLAVKCWLGWHKNATFFDAIADTPPHERLGCGTLCARCGRMTLWIPYRPRVSQ